MAQSPNQLSKSRSDIPKVSVSPVDSIFDSNSCITSMISTPSPSSATGENPNQGQGIINLLNESEITHPSTPVPPQLSDVQQTQDVSQVAHPPHQQPPLGVLSEPPSLQQQTAEHQQHPGGPSVGSVGALPSVVPQIQQQPQASQQHHVMPPQAQQPVPPVPLAAQREQPPQDVLARQQLQPPPQSTPIPPPSHQHQQQEQQQLRQPQPQHQPPIMSQPPQPPQMSVQPPSSDHPVDYVITNHSKPQGPERTPFTIWFNGPNVPIKVSVVFGAFRTVPVVPSAQAAHHGQHQDYSVTLEVPQKHLAATIDPASGRVPVYFVVVEPQPPYRDLASIYVCEYTYDWVAGVYPSVHGYQQREGQQHMLPSPGEPPIPRQQQPPAPQQQQYPPHESLHYLPMAVASQSNDRPPPSSQLQPQPHANASGAQPGNPIPVPQEYTPFQQYQLPLPPKHARTPSDVGSRSGYPLYHRRSHHGSQGSQGSIGSISYLTGPGSPSLGSVPPVNNPYYYYQYSEEGVPGQAQPGAGQQPQQPQPSSPHPHPHMIPMHVPGANNGGGNGGPPVHPSSVPLQHHAPAGYYEDWSTASAGTATAPPSTGPSSLGSMPPTPHWISMSSGPPTAPPTYGPYETLRQQSYPGPSSGLVPPGGTASVPAAPVSAPIPSNGGTNPVRYDYSSATPHLVRTSALSQAAASLGHAHQQRVEEDISAQASLHILTDLNLMTENWTVDEQRAQRRLVQFSREQRGPVILARFEALRQDQYDQDIPCISCIYWAEKQDFYVTSVDCLYLLEQLINTKFKVDEKNRIRRNLEGYHPLTISKGGGSRATHGTSAISVSASGPGVGGVGGSKVKHSPSAGDGNYGEFFKLIMSFPTPKPRNIEKDVKVFRWIALEQALKKIVSKYSADYSRTMRS